MQVRHGEAKRVSGNLGPLPLDRESNRGRADDAEIEGVVRVLLHVLGVYDQPSPEGLLDARVKVIAPTGINRSQIAIDPRRRYKNCKERTIASSARNDQILVERRLQRSRVRNAQHSACPFDVVGDA